MSTEVVIYVIFVFFFSDLKKNNCKYEENEFLSCLSLQYIVFERP